MKPGATPAPPQASAPSSAALSASDRLLNEANVLRERSGSANALARLQDASQRDPKNPQVLAEMAAIYESIQLYDRSNETWKKIQDLGPSAGPLYELADMKLRVGRLRRRRRAWPWTRQANRWTRRARRRIRLRCDEH